MFQERKALKTLPKHKNEIREGNVVVSGLALLKRDIKFLNE